MDYQINTYELLLKHNNNREEAVNELFGLIRSDKIQFPYQKLFRAENIDYIFSNLQKIQLHPIYQAYHLYSYYPKYGNYLPPRFRGKHVIIGGFGLRLYKTIDILSDYFIEDVRLSARRYDQTKSIIQIWQDDNELKKLLHRLLTLEELTPATIRDYIYLNIPETKSFNPSWAKTILQTVLGPNLSGKRWLDISAGWGDRLLTAMALNMQYLGYDPNIKLQKGHIEMIEHFGDGNIHKIIYEPFEQTILPNMEFDVIFTSPPFFDVETYAEGQIGQSIVSYPDLNKWMVWFLFASLLKAWDKLAYGGYLILHLGDTRLIKICEATNIFIEHNLVDASWEGVIGLQTEAHYPRPVWVWKKTKKNTVIWEPTVGENKLALNSSKRTLYNTYPELQIELVNFYACKLSPLLQLTEANVDLIRKAIINKLPTISPEKISQIFSNDLILYSLCENIGLERTIDWCVKMLREIL